MNERSYRIALRGLRMCLLMLPIILVGPITALLFPEVEGQVHKMLAKFGLALIWVGVGLGAVGLLTFLFHRSAVPQSERLQILIDVKPFIYLNLLALGGFICLTLLR